MILITWQHLANLEADHVTSCAKVKRSPKLGQPQGNSAWVWKRLKFSWKTFLCTVDWVTVYCAVNCRPEWVERAKVGKKESIIASPGVWNFTTPHFLFDFDYTLWEKFMSANGHGIIALTGRAHCQRKVAFFFFNLTLGFQWNRVWVCPPACHQACDRRFHSSTGCGWDILIKSKLIIF